METSEEVKVKGREPVKVRWNLKSRFHKAGDTSVVHRMQAEKLVKRKVAVIVN
jgi:hypothetical protein